MRRLHLAFLALWAGPGAILSWLLRDVLAWTAFMSWYAIVITHFAAWRADEPNPG